MTTGQKIASASGITAIIVLIAYVIYAVSQGSKNAVYNAFVSSGTVNGVSPLTAQANQNSLSTVQSIANPSVNADGSTNLDNPGTNSSSSSNNATGSNSNSILPLGGSSNTATDYTDQSGGVNPFAGQGIN